MILMTCVFVEYLSLTKKINLMWKNKIVWVKLYKKSSFIDILLAFCLSNVNTCLWINLINCDDSGCE